MMSVQHKPRDLTYAPGQDIACGVILAQSDNVPSKPTINNDGCKLIQAATQRASDWASPGLDKEFWSLKTFPLIAPGHNAPPGANVSPQGES